MPENPFAPHSPAPPEAFVGREREVDLVFGHINAVQRGNVAVSGPLGIGKTSLLRYIAAPEVAAEYGLRPPEYALLYVDIQSVTPFGADRFWRRVAQLLSRTPSVDLDEPVARLLARQPIDVIDLEEFLDEVALQRRTLVLLLDEFEWALRADTAEAEAESRNFLAQTASLARRAPRALSLVVATEATLPEATRVIESWRGSPFATIFTSIRLKPLSRDDAERLLAQALAGAEAFRDDERQLLYTFSGGQPAALQAAAFSLFHGRLQGLDREHLWEAARASASLALESLEPAGPATGPAPAPTGERETNGSGAKAGLYVEPATGEVTLEGRRVDSLTALEYNLLRLLYANAGRLCSKDDIIRHVWGDEFMGEIDDSRVEKLISRLRRKIEPMPGRPQYVRTVRGRGYRFVS